MLHSLSSSLSLFLSLSLSLSRSRCLSGGYYQLGAPFWAQAQITQLVEIGWTMLPVGRGSGTLANGAAFVTFVSPTRADFTIVIVTSATSPSAVTFKLLPPGGSVAAPRGPLHVWTTTRGSPFKAGLPVTATPAGEVTVSVPAQAVVSLSTIADAAHVEFPGAIRSLSLSLSLSLTVCVCV